MVPELRVSGPVAPWFVDAVGVAVDSTEPRVTADQVVLAGVATFDNLWLDKAAAGYTLSASAMARWVDSASARAGSRIAVASGVIFSERFPKTWRCSLSTVA